MIRVRRSGDPFENVAKPRSKKREIKHVQINTHRTQRTSVSPSIALTLLSMSSPVCMSANSCALSPCVRC